MRTRTPLALSLTVSLGCFSEPFLAPDGPATSQADGSEAGSDASSSEDASGEGTTGSGSSGADGTDDASSGGDEASTDSGNAQTSASDETGTTGDTTLVGPLVPDDNLDDGAIYPAANGYSAHWYPSGEDNAEGRQYLGQFPNGAQYYAYMRFRLPAAVPAGSIIDSAVLEIAGHDEYAWAGAYALRVWVQDTPDAPAVGGVTDYPQDGGSVVLSADSVRWPEVGGLPWQQPGPNATPDLAPLLQALVDTHGGLAADAYVQFWIGEDVLDGSGEEVGWFDSLAGAEHAPRLTLRVVPP